MEYVLAGLDRMENFQSAGRIYRGLTKFLGVLFALKD